MITNIKISGFKNIDNFESDLKSLTVITGKNSTGKSSILQSVLHCQSHSLVSPYSYFISPNFESARNKYINAKEITIELANTSGTSRLVWNADSLTIEETGNEGMPVLEESLYYLSASRTGAQNVGMVNDYMKSGPAGEFLFGTFEKEKSNPVSPDLIKYQESYTLSSQVNYWLSYILGIKLELNTESRPAQTVEIKYNSDNIPNILPTQLGAGVSYAAKILILCLRSNPGDIIMIENPEIHLYPGAQSKLMEFLSFISKNNRQLIIETHSDVLLTKLRHEVYRGNLPAEETIILYKNDITSPFEIIKLDCNGNFEPEFPESFFDATLKELLEMA